MHHTLELFHNILGNCRAVAYFLGYSLRGYMNIRRKVKNGLPLNSRVEAHLQLKASQLVSEPASTSTEGVASVTDHISNNNISGCQKEFAKALKRIRSLFQAGKSRKEIHARLCEAGRITMCYASFCNLFNKENARDPFISNVDKGRPGAESAPCTKPGRPVKRPSRR